MKTKIVYFQDGTSIAVDDGVTWEYENDDNWIKTVPVNTIVEELKAQIKWLCETIEPMLDEKYEYDSQLMLSIDAIKETYL